MKILFGMAAVAAATLAAAFMLFAQDYQKDKVKGLLTFSTNERQCFNHHVREFKDPSTAFLADSVETGTAVIITVMAKNGYGAYGETLEACRLNAGEFDENHMYTLGMFERQIERKDFSCGVAESYEYVSDPGDSEGDYFLVDCLSDGKYRLGETEAGTVSRN